MTDDTSTPGPVGSPVDRGVGPLALDGCQHPLESIQTGCDAKYSMAWCGICGAITHCADGIHDTDLARQDRERWCKERVIAFGCLSEARGGKQCGYWCGHPEHCAVSLRLNVRGNAG